MHSIKARIKHTSVYVHFAVMTRLNSVHYTCGTRLNSANFARFTRWKEYNLLAKHD
jgi:hypothetical protein